jgi:nucleotide-binding universal stress UspA family protein
VTSRPSILCPIDFSEASQSAVRYAIALAGHFGATVTFFTANDPILAEAAELKLGADWLDNDCRTAMAKFLGDAIPGKTPAGVDVRYQVGTGKAAPEILRVARDEGCDLIVMSSHGLGGFRKFFFGATTERVLRETTAPVLVTPAARPGPLTFEDAVDAVRRVLVPVDLVASPDAQLAVARAIGDTLGIPLLLVHVLEPLRSPVPTPIHLPGVDLERRAQADGRLAALVASLPQGARIEALTAFGDAAEEIAKVATDRQAGLIVMGLHASAGSGGRMGSVTYRVLCLAPVLVLALPPAPDVMPVDGR